MKTYFFSIKRFVIAHYFLAVMCLAAAWMVYSYALLPQDREGKRSLLSLILTPDQQGLWYMKNKDYKKAAAHFSDSRFAAAARFKDGQFKDAAALFSTHTDPVSMFNQGTALIMAGQYDDAISRLQIALDAAPDFEAARINLEIAKIRKEKMRPSEEDSPGTGGMLEADDFVFSDNPSSSSQNQTENLDSKMSMSEAQMRALWLRRLDSSPKDFLKVKFAYQHATRQDIKK